MKTYSSCHIHAFLSNFEIACEAGIFALAADLTWVYHDVLANGLSLWYIGISTGLSLGLGLTIFALYRHHKHYTHRFLKKSKG